MKTVAELPSRVRVVENEWLPLSDGTRLAARMWLPADAAHRPVPALLEYLPYRKRDFMRGRDGPMHYYFAGHGYASIRVDIRGAGDSEGLTFDEYTMMRSRSSPGSRPSPGAMARWECSGSPGAASIRCKSLPAHPAP